MKKFIVTFLLGSLLISCGSNEEDKFTGKWVSSDWERDSKTLEISKKGKNKYIVKSSFPEKEESAIIDKKNEDTLIIGEGTWRETVKYDNGTEELRTLSINYIKVDEQLQNEIDNHIKELINGITGNWKEEVKELNLFSYGDEKKEPIEIYNYEITPDKEKNNVNIKVELLIAKNNKKIVSEGVFEVLTNGQLSHVKTIGKNTNFFPKSFFMNISEIKRFQRVN